MNIKLSLGELIFSVVYFSLSATSLLSYEKYHFIDPSWILEITLVIFLLIYSKPKEYKALVISMLFMFFILVSFIINVGFVDVSVRDFLIAYKSLVYITVLGMISGKVFFHEDYIRRVFLFTIYVFFIKYALWHVFSDTNRPALLVENNFELLFLLLISSAYISQGFKVSKFEYIVILSIFILSGSRSGIMAFLTFWFIFEGLRYDKWIINRFLAFILLSIFVLGVFLSRMDGLSLEQIDRISFLNNFFISIKHWDILNYFFGNFTLQPLSEESCRNLLYYKDLFSESNSNICYSVILHAYVLRTIYDFGLIGFGVIVYSLYTLLRINGLNVRTSSGVILVVLMNGLSVSALNSVFSALGILFLIGGKNGR
ncbi:hypothetical protein ACOCGM_003407 [Vibrio cholerae]|nr:hypothetical protein [Vibrio cholerae]